MLSLDRDEQKLTKVVWNPWLLNDVNIFNKTNNNFNLLLFKL